MILAGWNRVPRRGLPASEDIAAVWMLLSDRQRAHVEAAANADGVTTEMHIRRRWAVCARALIGPTWARGVRGVTPLQGDEQKAHNGEA